MDAATSSASVGHVRYRPLAAFLGWTLVGAGIWVALRGPLGTLAAQLDSGDAWLGAFLARLVDSAYQEAMAILLIGALLYACAQSVALARDTRFIAGHASGGFVDRIRAAAAGRGVGFWTTGRGTVAWRDAHVAQGGPAGMTPLRILVWTFPMLGFLGTVYGLSGAVAALGRQAQSAGGMDAQAIAPILQNLDVAFDTTIQGIVSALALTVTVAALDLRWSGLGRTEPASPSGGEARAAAGVPQATPTRVTAEGAPRKHGGPA